MNYREEQARSRMASWAEMVYSCKNSGMTVEDWCAEQNLPPTTYYSRQKKVMTYLEEHGVVVSMDGKGQALDNARTERFFRSLKYEDIYLNDYEKPKELVRAVNHYIRHYNEIRPHQALGNKTPNEISRHAPSYLAA